MIGGLFFWMCSVPELMEAPALPHLSFTVCKSITGGRSHLLAAVCKVYRFQTEDQRWMLVREQLSETPLSFSLPKQLLSALIQEHTSRVQQVKELGDLSPHWDGLRHDVISHCNHLIGCYREILTELNKPWTCFKSCSSRSNRYLQFVPTNLHSQRMMVTDPGSTGTSTRWFSFVPPFLLLVFTFSHYFSVSYSQEESYRARELLSCVAQLQPLVFGLADELLAVSLELNMSRLQQVLDSLTQQTNLLVHTLKEELVKSALLEIHNQCTATSNSSHVHSNGLVCDNSPASQDGPQDVVRRDVYDEEEWDRVWANVAKSLNCIVIMMDRLQAAEDKTSQNTGGMLFHGSTKIASPSSSSLFSWQEHLLPLVVTFRDCVREAVGKAQVAMTFVILQGAVATTVGQGPAHIVQRRHAVFSQALSAVTCGFMLKLYGGLEDAGFLQQLHSVGILAEFKSLLSTNGDEEGILEDMEVGVADLSDVAFTITKAKTEEDLLPMLTGTWGNFVVEVPLPSENFGLLPQRLKDGCLIRVHPVHFNIGIDHQQILISPDQSLSDLLASLDRNVHTRKSKNVEVLWIAAMVCRKVNGVRLTSCKSAKDRTAMSVTLEQCVLLQQRHKLSQQHFNTALDCMRGTGCRMENVQKNVGSRKFAFSSVQLLTFPKLYRPPEGSYGWTH
uniref:Inositol polyphosphate-4-phosphatase type II B n=1 Tax=Monopterus albus TaxID=43700 RepID=A0A3Q3INQ3_MONAL